MAKLRTAKKYFDPTCEHPGCTERAYHVDHIIPNAEDPTLRYEWSNLQSLCHRHHKEKTTQDALRGKTRPR